MQRLLIAIIGSLCMQQEPAEVLKVWTDYPNTAAYLRSPRFQLTDEQEDADIIFTPTPVNNFYALGE